VDALSQLQEDTGQRLTKNVIDILNTLFADELLEGSTRALYGHEISRFCASKNSSSSTWPSPGLTHLQLLQHTKCRCDPSTTHLNMKKICSCHSSGPGSPTMPNMP